MRLEVLPMHLTGASASSVCVLSPSRPAGDPYSGGVLAWCASMLQHPRTLAGEMMEVPEKRALKVYRDNWKAMLQVCEIQDRVQALVALQDNTAAVETNTAQAAESTAAVRDLTGESRAVCEQPESLVGRRRRAEGRTVKRTQRRCQAWGVPWRPARWRRARRGCGGRRWTRLRWASWSTRAPSSRAAACGTRCWAIPWDHGTRAGDVPAER